MALNPPPDPVHPDAATRESKAQSLMADSQSQNTYLSQNQQDLLVAALNSQAGGRQNSYPPVGAATSHSSSQSPVQPLNMNSFNDNTLYISPQQATLDDFKQDYSPDLDFDESFDFDNADLGGEMIGALPGDSTSTDLHEKRKNSDEYEDGEEGDAKRQETQEGEKTAKKPGRKPLTSEPTTKRKAQNRAAQRAFRERKEKHLKDLETKVSELTKSQEADKHENGLLKAQVERLQVELREYRKRLSLNAGSGANRSPPSTGYGQTTRSNSNPSAYSNGFNFDFPKFGGLPGSQMFTNQSYSSTGSSNGPRQNAEHSQTSGIIGMPSQQNQNGSRQNSIGPSLSPVSLTGTSTGSPAQTTMFDTTTFATYSTNDNMHGFASTLPQMNGGGDPFNDLFSPGLLKNAGNTNYFTPEPTTTNAQVQSNNIADINGGDNTAGLNRVFQFNSASSGSDSASPSASSASQWNGNANSSCGTSPEPSHGSPANKATDKVNGVRHQSPLATSNQAPSITNNQFTTPDYSLPSLNTFDPVLFGDYRDSQDAIVGGGDFSGGFFDDALQPFDYNSPSNLFGILQSPQPAHQELQISKSSATNAPTPSQNLMAEMDKARDGGDETPPLSTTTQSKNEKKVLPDGKYISCNNIWNQLQSNPDFQEGKFDLDSLCSELKTKARCSESGVMVDQEHVDAAIRKLGKKDDKGKDFAIPSGLMFEQDSWDNVLKKLGNNE